MLSLQLKILIIVVGYPNGAGVLLNLNKQK
jgi:hypothetical protein